MLFSGVAKEAAREILQLVCVPVVTERSLKAFHDEKIILFEKIFRKLTGRVLEIVTRSKYVKM